MRLRRGPKLAGPALAALLLLLLSASARAQQEQPSDDEVNAIAKGLYCPVCENVPLDVCPTLACKQWRETIREKLALGWTQAQIEDYFVAQYGDRVLASPPPGGLNWLVYVLPPLAFVAGAFILAQAVRSWRPKPAEEAQPSAESDPYRQRLEEELSRRA
ncbi:MAG TPA: cytochrome c-type biogenesis protein [Anaerolineales bacterium]